MRHAPISVALFLAITPAAVGQATAFGPEQVITNAAYQVVDIYAADLDGDGDADVLSASVSTANGHKIAWYENLGGGAFGAQQVISVAVDVPSGVFAIDLDGDGDADVLSSSEFDDKIAWYENLGGGGFGAQQVITTAADKAKDVFAIDLDGDGDADVLSASYNDATIAWYENLGGGAFGSEQVISSSNSLSLAVCATDLDGDGDADVVALKNTFDSVTWYENLGGGSFGPTQVVFLPFAAEATFIALGDLDGDGDADLLTSLSWSNSCQGTTLGWLENLGGAFGPVNAIAPPCGVSGSIETADVDGDGDVDVIVSASGGVRWYENLGGGTFGPSESISPSGGVRLLTVDLDGDGNTDLLTCLGDEVAWHENLDPAVTTYCVQSKPTSVSGCSAMLSIPNDSLTSGVWLSTDIPRDASLGSGTVVGTYIYTTGVGTGPSTFSASTPFGSLCLSGLARSGPVVLPGAIGGVCNAGPMALFVSTLDGPPLALGEDVNVQLWHRDPLPTNAGNANFSNAIFYTVQ